jgi:predicted dehydrogenase
MVYRVAIVGCGRIAGQMDHDPRRTEIWTHAGAYTALSQVALVAAADIDLQKLEEFGKRWDIPALYHDYRQMLEQERPDILSICTHSPLHLPIAKAGVETGVKAIFCEKPLAACVEEADEMVTVCQQTGTVLAVNHTRRWDDTYRKVKTLLASGRVGKIQAMTAYYTGGVANIGSHLFDVLRFLGGEVRWVRAECVNSKNHLDPDVSGSFYFDDDILCHIHGCNQQNYLLVEIDLIGTKGRVRISHNGACVDLWTASESERYTGYQELVAQQPLVLPSNNRRMVNAVEDVLLCIQTGGTPQCSGTDGRAALELVTAFRQSSRMGGEKIALPLKERGLNIPSK